MTQEDLKKVLVTVYRNIRCPQCGKNYDFGRIHIKGFFNNLCFLELNCKDHLPLYATIASPVKKVEEVKAEVIDSDYLINAYEIIKNHQGSLSEIIK